MHLLSAVVVVLASVASAQVAPDGDRFHHAIRQDDLVSLRALVRDAGAGVRDAQGHTPLMLAAAFGSASAVRLLLDNGADARAVTPAGVTALHLAVTDAAKTRLLLDAGADVHAVSQIGRTPLLVAASVHGATDVVRLLLDRGAKVAVADSIGSTPLSAAALVGNREIGLLLMDRGANPGAPAGSNPLAMPMFGAATNGDTALIKAMLARGADVNAPSSDLGALVKHGRTTFARITPLHLAVNSLSLEAVGAVLAAGATVDAQDIRGMTPLMFAVATDRPNLQIVSLLLRAGAKPGLRDAEGESAMDWARKFKHPGVLKALNINVVLSGPAPRTDTAPLLASHDLSRQAVQRALAPLRDVSASFFAKGGCIACHAQPLTGIAVSLAHARGWTPANMEPEMAAMATTLNSGAPAMLQFREAGGMPDNFLYMMLSMAAEGTAASRATDAMVRYLAAKQRMSGEWQGIGGTRAPMQDGDINRTALAIRALTAYAVPALAADYRHRIRRAAEWLRRQTPVSTQDLVMQLLGLHWADSHERIRRAGIRELTALQRPDGGWGQTPYLPSDAYATGQALYALRTLAVPAADAAVQRGAAFLVRTQEQDGTWHVANRAMKLQPYFDSGFPHEHDQWISHAGSAWATMALIVTTEGTVASTARR